MCDEACFQQNKSTYEALYEYQSQYGLALSNASSAYARGATGSGMTIGVVDSGLDDSHLEITSSKIQSGSQLNYSNYTPTTKQRRHGTAVSSIAAGKSSGDSSSPMHGVAYDAKIFFIAVQLGEASEDYEPIDLGDSSGAGAPDYSGVDNFYDQVFEIFINNSVDVVNNSFGFTGTINEYTEAQLRANFPNTISRISQSTVMDQDKTLFVWAAGNTGQYADQGADYSSPDVFPGMAHRISELKGHSLAVVSVDSDGIISDFSSRCGIAKDFCLAAPGEGIVVAYPTSQSDPGIYEATDSCVANNSCYAMGGGTSYSAPYVAGGLALLAQHFNDQLGNTEILERILLTADKSGIYSDESIYGQGLMDLNAASQPVGSAMVATGFSLESSLYSIQSSSISQMGGVIGDGLWNAISKKEFVVFDQLGAPFNRSLSETYINNLPSLAWLSSRQSNPSQRIREIETKISKNTFITLGLASNNYGEHDFSQTLWAKDDRNLRQIAVKGKLSQSTSYFMGNGFSPSVYLGVRNDKLKNKLGRSSFNSSPFLDLTSSGSFIGAGLEINSNTDISAVAFKGKNPESERFLKQQPEMSGILLEYKKNSINYQISFQTGLLNEPKAFLGGSLGGAYGDLDESKSYFSGIQALYEFTNFYTSGSLFYGKTITNFNKVGLISNMNNFKSSSLSLGLFSKKGFGEDDSFGVLLSQPLRLEEGEIDLSVPIGRTKSRSVLFEDYSVDLSPSGREMNLQFVYSWPFLKGSFSSRLGFVKDPGHFANQDQQIYISTNFEFFLN